MNNYVQCIGKSVYILYRIFCESMSRSKLLTASYIRQRYLKYFAQNEHIFIRSSSVKPFGDSSLEFVNAGMNQVMVKESLNFALRYQPVLSNLSTFISQ